jgi:hypothetical protein
MADEHTEPQGDEALEKLAGKLADAAGKNDVSALQTIVRDFYRDAVDLRTKNRELNTQLKDLGKRLPKDGEVILSGADAKAYAEFQKLGIPTAELTKKLADGSAAQGRVAEYERDQTAYKAAELAGYKAKALRQIVRLHNLNLQLADIPDPSGARDEDGKVRKVRSPVVIPEGENAEAIPLTEYVDEHLGDFRDVLAVSEAERTRREPPTQQGPRVIRQKAGESGAGRGVPDEQIAAEIRSRHAGMSV